MELKNLTTFKTIIEAGSFQKAADQLGYAQSTITFQIQQLEDELSVQLFEKIGRRMVLSQAGKDILPYVEHILNGVELLENYGKQSEELKGTLKIVVPETLLTYQMQSVLKKFKEQAPDVKLSVDMLGSVDICSKVINGECDLGFHYDLGEYGSSVIVEKLVKYPLTLIAPPDLSEEECDFITPGKSKSIAMIVGDHHSIFQHTLDTYLEEKKIKMGDILDINSIEAIKRCVASNLGISYLPYYVVEDYLAHGLVKEIKTDMRQEATAVCIYHKNKWMTPAMKLFMQLAKMTLRT